MSRCLLLMVVCFTAIRAEAQLLGPPLSPDQIVVDATNVLAQSVAMRDGLPQRMLADAQGIAIVPNMVRGAFVIGLQHGRGVLLTRGPGGAWQPPLMIQITGGSLGYQIGVQSTDLILIFRTPQSVANVLRGTLKVGVDASAAAGPVGRQASAATDLPLQAEILSYSRARGAFVGVSIDGSSISLDPAADTMPNARLRRSGATTRAAMLEAMPDVVHDRAMPISTPAPSVIMAALVAIAVITRPAM